MTSARSNLRKKTVFIMSVIFLMLIVVFLRLIFIQIYQGSYWQQRAESTRTRETPIVAKRGNIFDRNGNTLAVSISADSVYVSPMDVDTDKKEEIAQFLSGLLQMDYETVMGRLNSKNNFVWLKRKVDFDISKQIMEAGYKGINIIEEPRRYYPKNTLLAQVLGFAGADNQGLEGIELTYESLLKGIDGSILTEYDAKSNEIPQSVHKVVEAQDGQGLVLTIDENIQFICERAIANVMAGEEPPASAAILVMSTQTAEVLAMAMSGNGDPNDFGSYGASAFRNTLVCDSYEPGSTFKMITTSIALEEGVINESTRFYDPGYIMVGKNKIKCWRHYRPHGEQDLKDALKNSCNPAFVTIGLMLEEKEHGLFYKYVRAFGFGSRTDVGLSGEAAGIMRKEESLITLDLATMAFGQSISVTPLQMVTAVSAIANGGRLLQPQIIRQVVGADGNIVQDFSVKEVRQVISEGTSKKMCNLLEYVVAKGTGSGAYVEGYRVAGKTGTAQKAGAGGYLDGKYVASFCGFAPSNDPQITVLVLINEPSGALYQGGQVAAPVAQIIFSEVLRYLNVPVQIADKAASIGFDKPINAKVPNLLNLSAEAAQEVLRLYGFKAELKGSGTRIVAQSVEAGKEAAVGSVVAITRGTGGELLCVPDLTGLSLGEATNILSAYGLKLKPIGSGSVYEQSPRPNAEVKAGTVISLTLASEDEKDADTSVVAP